MAVMSRERVSTIVDMEERRELLEIVGDVGEWPWFGSMIFWICLLTGEGGPNAGAAD